MNDRAASEVLSFALVFGLVVGSVAIISVSGMNSLENTRDAEQINNAIRSYDVLADNLADIHQRGAPSRATEINLEKAQLYTGENVTINVSVYRSGSLSTSVQKDVRPIVYQGNEDRRLVYEGGAVFHVPREGGRVDQRPPMVTRSDRLLLPIVQTRTGGIESVGGSTVLVRGLRKSTKLPIKTTASDISKVSVNVTSPRRDLWQEYFESTPLDDCTPGTNAFNDPYVECSTTTAPDRVYVPVHVIDVDIE